MKVPIMSVMAILLLVLTVNAEDSGPMYKDDPSIIKIIEDLKPGEIIKLPKCKVMPEDASKYHSTFKDGPGGRNYGMKMPYAPDRQTAVYCGGNHGVPHRFNDVWEYHLGSHTWHLLRSPGIDLTVMNNYGNKLRILKRKPEENAEKIKELEKKRVEWWDGAEIADGYFRDKVTKGPIWPGHTWDGITYDHVNKQLYWNTLVAFKRRHQQKLEQYAKATGKNYDDIVKELKPPVSMYMYDFAKNEWVPQENSGPAPRMWGMGSTIHYIPDIDKTIFYCCVGNVPGGYTEGMWSYDAKTNCWKELIPGKEVRKLWEKEKVAPGEELQVAYSTKDKKLVAVQGNRTFIYDIAENKWSRGKDGPVYAHDADSTFVYDEDTGDFLLLGREANKRRAKVLLSIFSYNISEDKWEKIITPALLADDTGANWRRYTTGYPGYYDPIHHVFVLYSKRGTFLYKHK